jgi:uncharacterized protein YbaP (TraB family)
MIRRSLVATAAFLGFAGLAWAAEPPECVGRNMLADLAVSAPKLSARLAEAEKIIPNGQAVLWRITDKTGKIPPSHLFGTIHLTSTEVHVLPAETRAAIESASVVALEVREAVNPREHLRAYYRNARFMAMPLGTDMWDLIPDADEKFIRAAPQIAPERMVTIGSLQPWVVAFQLSYPMCEVARQQADLPFLDRAIGQTALARNIPLVGLEKIEEQMAILAGAPLEDQARFLVAVAKYGDQLVDLMETYKRLYLERRLASLWLLSIQGVPTDQPDPVMSAYIESKIVNRRNEIMADRALPLIANGNAFIAVGAAHLPGDKGLVELLRKAGYEVTPVN